MKPSPICFLFALASMLLLFQSSADAQYIIGVSSLTENSATHTIQGAASTQMDYNTQLYYSGYVVSYIYKTDPNVRLDNKYTASGSNGIAAVSTQATGTTPWTVYNLRSEHYYWPLYPSCTFPGSCAKYDYYGYLYRTPQYTGITQYGSNKTFSTSGLYVTYAAPNYILLGNTNAPIRTAPTLSITNPRVSGNLHGTTQNALVGAVIALNASVIPSSGTGGAYSWSFTAPYTLEGGTLNSSSVTIRTEHIGTFTANVSYTLNGVTTTASMSINSVVPTLTSYTAQVVDVDQINRGPRCSNLPTIGAIYSLGCAIPNPNNTWNINSGIIFTATAQIPTGNYLTDPAEAGIKFKQFISQFRKRILDVDIWGRYAFGQLECKTRRSSESNIDSGWQVDGNEAYGHSIRPVPRFSQGNTLTYQTFDAPADTLDDTLTSQTSNPRMVDAFYADDRFEMYVDYFVGPNPNLPLFKRALKLASGTNHNYHRVVWRWGGQAHYDAAVPNTRYRMQFSTTSPQGTINATGTNSILPFSGNASNTDYGICPGGAGPSNIRIDGTRYFVLQLYWDVLHRTADQGGWDGWTSVITRCGFNQNCINSIRSAVARGFLESAENFANNPALANPGSHQYNKEYVRLCYTSFLRRGPDQAGWDGWTDYIDNHPGAYDILVGGFINSSEYRNRLFPDRN